MAFQVTEEITTENENRIESGIATPTTKVCTKLIHHGRVKQHTCPAGIRVDLPHLLSIGAIADSSKDV